MPNPFQLRPAEPYVFHLDVGEEKPFQGPMDLLLKLIEQEELPITSVSLVQITGQYLAHLAEMEELQPEGIAEFLVMAARLIYIKSAALLPRPAAESEEEEEDPAETLARQLREYKLFKQRAALLQTLEEAGQRAYVRLAPPPQLQKRLEPGGLNVATLLDALYAVLEDLEAPPRPIHSIAPLDITIDACMAALKKGLAGGKSVHFRQFLGQARGRIEVLVHFLALLEMIKLGEIAVRQEKMFGEIVIEGVAQEARLPVDV